MATASARQHGMAEPVAGRLRSIPPYDFNAFLTSTVPLDYIEILHRTETECAKADRGSSKRRGSPKRELDKITYARQMREFLLFMRHCIRPASVSDYDFESYRPVVEALVAKGQMTSEALTKFRGNDDSATVDCRTAAT
jgi:hypothetical protein